MEIPVNKKRILEPLARVFRENLPDSLFMDYEQLTTLTKSKPSMWEELLDYPEIARYVDQKLAKHMRVEGRKALNKLRQSHNLTTQEISAITKTIENAKILESRHTPTQTVFVTHLPRIDDPVKGVVVPDE